MASGKDDARAERLAAIHSIRLAALKHDANVDDSQRQWPAASVAVWRDIAENYPNHPAHAWALEVIAVAGG